MTKKLILNINLDFFIKIQSEFFSIKCINKSSFLFVFNFIMYILTKQCILKFFIFIPIYNYLLLLLLNIHIHIDSITKNTTKSKIKVFLSL